MTLRKLAALLTGILLFAAGLAAAAPTSSPRSLAGSSRDDQSAAQGTSASASAGAVYRLVTAVQHGEVAVRRDDRRATISCKQPFGKSMGRVFAVGGGVRGDRSYAVGGTFPVVDKRGWPTGWAGTLTEMPRFKIYTVGRADWPSTDRALGRPWNHSHRYSLPSGLLFARNGHEPSTVSMFVVCAHLERTASAVSSPAGAGYRVVASVRHGVVAAKGGVAQISCGKSFGKTVGRSLALGGGVQGDRSYAVGATFPVFDAVGRPTGWAGALTEMPRSKMMFNERVRTERALAGSVWVHTHHFTMPNGLLRSGAYRSYSKISMYVVCAHLETTARTGPLLSAAASGYRLVANVRHAVVAANNRGVAKISCGPSFGKTAGRSFAFAGGVVSPDQGYSVGASSPAVDSRGRHTGWAGALTESPRLQIYTLGYAERPTSERALTGGPWDHTNRYVLPSGLLRLGVQRGYSTVSMYVVCAQLERTTTTPPPMGTTPTTSPNPMETTPTTTPDPMGTNPPLGADPELRAQWHLDEATGSSDTGSVSPDSSGNGLNLLVRSVGVVPGRFGNAFRFGTPASVTEYGGLSALLRPEQLTTMAWVRADASPGNLRYIVAQGGSDGCIPAAYGLYTGAQGQPNAGGISFYVTHAGAAYHAPSVPAANVWDGAWHMIAGTFDGAKARFYLDGTEIEDPMHSGTAVPGAIDYSQPSTKFRIGRYGGAFEEPCAGAITLFSGDIDEVRVYGRALTAAEINGLSAPTWTAPPT
jgi:hypothetical protein